MLYVDLKVHEFIDIGGVKITLQSKTGQLARLSIEADKNVKIITPMKNDRKQAR